MMQIPRQAAQTSHFTQGFFQREMRSSIRSVRRVK